MLGDDHVLFWYVMGLIATPFPGCFVTLYRALLNAFPILFPRHVPLRIRIRQLFSFAFSSPEDSAAVDSLSPDLELPHSRNGSSRTARLSTTAQAHQVWVRKRTSRWHSAIAGAIAGGLAIMFEKKSRRTVIAQQLFVRYVMYP